MTQDGRRSSEADDGQQSALARVVSAGEAALRFLSDGVEQLIDRVADIVADAEKAFRQGLDPNIEDAKIIDERKKPPKRKSPGGDEKTCDR